MIFASVRARLALWHTTVLAVLLVAVAAGAYAFVVRSVRARTDAALADALADLRTQLGAEGGERMSTRSVVVEVLQDMRFRTTALVVYDSAGRGFASSIPRPRPQAGESPEPTFDAQRLGRLLAASPPTRDAALTLPDAEGGFRVALTPMRMRDGRFTLAAATSLHGDMETLADARVTMVIAVPLVVLLAWAGGWLLARRSLEPMVHLRDVTARIGASNLGERVPVERVDDEVGQLATVINGLLERLEQAFAQQRQFMADASHELRTPVAVVKNEAALALSRADRTPDEYQDALTVVRSAAGRLQRIVEDLFFLSRADAGELPARRDPLYFDEVIAECARELRSLADERTVQIAIATSIEAPLVGDEALLRRLVINLLDNAIKYSARGQRVTVRLSRDGAGYRFEIENHGSPIPRQLQSAIFDRFVRADSARSRDGDTVTSGAGLGLSISRWIAEAHGGTLELARSDEQGTLFALTLPASRA